MSDFKNSLPSGEEQLGAEIVFKSLSVSNCSMTVSFHSCQNSTCVVLSTGGRGGEVTATRLKEYSRVTSYLYQPSGLAANQGSDAFLSLLEPQLAVSLE